MTDWNNKDKRIAFLALFRDLYTNKPFMLTGKEEDELLADTNNEHIEWSAKKAIELVDRLFTKYPNENENQ